jgi:methyl-accepting chemotaxis protein
VKSFGRGVAMASWFRGLRIKLLLLVILPTAVIGILGGLGYYSIHFLRDDLHIMGAEKLPQSAAIGIMEGSVQGVERALWIWHAADDNMALRAGAADQIGTLVESFEKAKTQFESTSIGEEEKKVWEGVNSNWPEVKKVIAAASEKLQLNTPAGDLAAKEILLSEMRQKLGAIGRALAKLSESNILSVKEVSQDALDFASKGLAIIGLIVGGGMLLTVGFGVFVAWKLSHQLSIIVSHLSGSADKVGVASHQLSAAGQKLSSGASQAASSLEETVASIEELSSMVKQNADNSKEAGALSQSARDSAEEGEREVQQLISAMGEISQSSRKIEEIINVIDDIAFQTNLLALNAAVEAARAGDQGRGFAVVAEAVRTLAQRSSEAAKDINGLIKESVNKVDRGTNIADRSGSVLKQIVVNSKKVADLNAEIAMASREQASGLSQISQAMNQLDTATQSNASSAEETASTSDQLSGESQQLRSQVMELVNVVEGQNVLPPTSKGSDETAKSSTHKSHVSNDKSSGAIVKYTASGPKAKATHSTASGNHSGHGPKAANNVVPLKKPSSGSSVAHQMIPFGDEEDFGSGAKIGNLSDF